MHRSGGWLSAELLHLLTEPDHLAMILFLVVVGAGWLLRRALVARLSALRRAVRAGAD